MRGTYLHCFWSCPRLQGFWKQVLCEIEIITETRLPLKPELILLNMWGTLKIDVPHKELVELLLCAAHSLIATVWKSPRILTLSDWFMKVWDFFLQDKISMSILWSDNLLVPNNQKEKWLPLLTAALSRKIDATLFANHTHYDLLSYFYC